MGMRGVPGVYARMWEEALCTPVGGREALCIPVGREVHPAVCTRR